mgnify:CR=1 FL=1
MRLSFLSLLILSAANVYAQPFQLKGFDVDTARQEWTAMTSFDYTVLISTVDNPHPSNQPQGQKVGNIRLRWYKYGQNGTFDPLLDTTQLFYGNARVSSIVGYSNDEFILGGGFADTLVLGQYTLVNNDPFSYDPFVFKVNRQGQVLWVWSVHRPQNNFFHRLKKHELNNYELLAVGLADDITGWIASINPNTGALLWEEIVTGSRTVSDAQVITSFGDTSLMITGSCANFTQMFGLQVPNATPITGYQNYLYRRDLKNQQGGFIKVVAHNTFDFEPYLLSKSFNTFSPLTWITPYEDDSLAGGFRQLKTEFSYDSFRNTYDEVYPLSISHDGIFSSLPSSNLWGFFSQQYVVYKAANGPINQLIIQNMDWMGKTFLNMGFNNPHPPLGVFDELANLWLAIPVNQNITYTSDFGSSGSILFPGISTSVPRWVLITRNEYTSLPKYPSVLKFDVYPNPAVHSQLTIRLSENNLVQTKWFLRDMQGKAVSRGHFSTAETILNLNQLQSGIYLLEIMQGNQKAFRKVVLP